MDGFMPQNMWNIRGRVCEIWSEQVWLLGLKLCLLWIPLIPVAHLSRSSVGLTHSQHGQNSQPVSKLNEICVFVYPILVIPRWGRQTIHNIILLTGIGAKMSHVACHTIRPHFSHCCEKKRKVKKLIIFNRW